MRATITTWCTFKATASAMRSPSEVHPLTLAALKAQLAFSLPEKSYWKIPLFLSFSLRLPQVLYKQGLSSPFRWYDPSRRRLFQTALSLFCDEGIVELMLKLATILKVNKFSCL